ncbi:protein suex-1-like [Artemia franciscana]|uniref:protein suex-1-like n=1 Tax=Artemia franciscana TaxID=6661 RepID=UPI0032D9F516
MKHLLILSFFFVGLILPAFSVPLPDDDAIIFGETQPAEAKTNTEEGENRFLFWGLKQRLLGGLFGGYGGYGGYGGGFYPPYYGGFYG